jgi:two-component system chemotaxis response regulator CheB
LREVRDLPIPTFRCRTGHLFSIDSLVAALEQDAEDGLWTALRVLFEAIDAERELAAAVRKRGDEKHARQAEERAARHARQIESIRAAIEME